MIKLRQVRRDDFQQLCEIYQQIHDIHVESIPNVFKKAQALSQEYFDALLANENVHFVVAEEGDILVGLCISELRPSNDIPVLRKRTLLSVESVGVREGWKGKRVGTKLFADAEKFARKNRADDMVLNVYDFNENAIHFYEKVGFKSLSRRMEKTLK